MSSCNHTIEQSCERHNAKRKRALEGGMSVLLCNTRKSATWKSPSISWDSRTTNLRNTRYSCANDDVTDRLRSITNAREPMHLGTLELLSTCSVEHLNIGECSTLGEETQILAHVHVWEIDDRYSWEGLTRKINEIQVIMFREGWKKKCHIWSLGCPRTWGIPKQSWNTKGATLSNG